MSHARTAAGEAATRLILTTFRSNGLLLEAGDAIGSRRGLTSARWQVLGAVALIDRPLTVPEIARRMGLARQSVHATVNRLVHDGLLERAANDGHRRSFYVRLTRKGAEAYEALDGDQAVWINGLTHGIPRADLAKAASVLEELSRRLEASVHGRGSAEGRDRA